MGIDMGDKLFDTYSKYDYPSYEDDVYNSSLVEDKKRELERVEMEKLKEERERLKKYLEFITPKATIPFAKATEIWTRGIDKEGIAIYFAFIETIEKLKVNGKLDKIVETDTHLLPHPVRDDKFMTASQFKELPNNTWSCEETYNGTTYQFILMHAPGF